MKLRKIDHNDGEIILLFVMIVVMLVVGIYVDPLALLVFVAAISLCIGIVVFFTVGVPYLWNKFVDWKEGEE